MSVSRVEAAAERSELIGRALDTARQLHHGAVRDIGDEVPFIDHPLAVAELLIENGQDEELVAAGLLHDTLEYTGLGLDALRERFGMKVAMIVCALSEDFEILDYEERKEELRDRVEDAGIEAQLVFGADKIANVIAVRDEYAIHQEDVDLGQSVDLDTQILVWEYDMEMLHATESEEPLLRRLPEELLGLWDQRGVQLRSES